MLVDQGPLNSRGICDNEPRSALGCRVESAVVFMSLILSRATQMVSIWCDILTSNCGRYGWATERLDAQEHHLCREVLPFPLPQRNGRLVLLH